MVGYREDGGKATGAKSPKSIGRWSGAALRFPMHVLFFSIYPILALLAANIGQVLPMEGARMLLASILLGLLLLAASWLLLRRLPSAAILASFTVLLILSYGHVYTGLKEAGLSGATVVRHRFLLPVALLLPPAVFMGLRRAKPDSLTPYLNVTAVAACLFPLTVLVTGELQRLAAMPNETDPTECRLSPVPGQALPDVYLIIMDAYERDDVLWEMHGYDNSDFIESLEGMGFYVARGSLSNYRHTELSISSLLNMDYVQSYPDSFVRGRYDQWSIIQKIKASQVRRDLECIGYETVAFETEAFWTEWDDADYYLTRQKGLLGGMGLLGGVSRFEEEFLQTTLARAYLDGAGIAAKGRTGALSPYAEARDLILFQFDQLERLPAIPSPKLVFVHVLSPHPPFVFGPHGEPAEEGEFSTGRTAGTAGGGQLAAYSNQVEYLNSRLVRAVSEILRQSEADPIIIIQGDHGWADRNPEDKLSILNAYHLPGAGGSLLYPTITPVNSFRLVLNTYFGGDFEVLDDVSYFSSEQAKFDFVEIENTWSGD